MKRVLVLIKGLGRGGAEQLLVNAASYWNFGRFRYEVAYLLPWKDALVGDLEAAGVEVTCLEGGRGAAWVGRLRRLCRDHEIDLVHCHTPSTAVGARLAVRRGRARMVATEHNVWERYHPITYWANMLTFPLNDHVFAVSQSVLESVRYPRLLRGLPMPASETLYHGPDPAAVGTWNVANGVKEELGIPHHVPVIGTVANFKAQKGHSYLLQAALKVRETVGDVRFLLIGQGPLEEKTKREAERLGLDGTVMFLGFREDVPRLASAFDVFALSSLHEGLSIALLEAMALGKPPVVTRVGGLPEVISDGTNGYVVPSRDPDALAEGISNLIQNASLRQRLGEAARERAADFDIRSAVRRMETVYEELLK